MKNQRKLLPYKVVIGLLLITLIGSVGYSVNASTLRDSILDKVADRIANAILNEEVGPTEETLGFTSSSELITNNNAWMQGSNRAIYFGTANATYGIRDSSGTLQYKNSGGTWSSIGTTAIAGGGWIADGSNLVIYPTVNAYGNQYPICANCTATSTVSGSDATTVIAASGGVVASGTLYIGGASTLVGAVSTTAAITVGTDATITSGARVGTGSSGGHITALANDSLFVEGESEFDGIAWFDDSLRASSTLMVTGASILTGNVSMAGTLAVTGASTFTGLATFGNASSTLMSVATTAYIGGANGLVLSDGSILDASGAISFGDDNLTTTGTLTADNTTINGSFIANEASENVDFRIESNDVANIFFVSGSANAIGIGTSTPVNKLVVLDGTNAQLQLSYDGSNSSLFTTGSGGDLTIAPSGGDLSITGTLSISSSLTATGATVLNGGLTMDTNKFTVADTTGNTIVGGTLGVTGVATLTTNLVVDTNTLLVDASNNRVGVGTSTPANQLEVHAATGTTTISVIAEAASTGARIIIEDSDGAGCTEIYALNGTLTSVTVACPAN